MTQCPQCGHGLPDTNDTLSIAMDESASSAERIRGEIKRLNDHILRLGQAIARFSEDTVRLRRGRVTLYRRLNDAQAATRCLPPEVLSDIFLLARPPIDFSTRTLSFKHSGNPRRQSTYFREEDFHFNLAAVSHRWRRVVCSTPRLWTSISVGICSEIIGSTISLLDMYFRNAHGLMMNIEIDLRQFGADSDSFSRHLLVDMENRIFAPNSSMIGGLVLIGFPLKWTPIIMTKYLSRCTSVTVRRPKGLPHDLTEADVREGRINFTELPCLQHVTLDYVYTPFTLPYPSITSLNLRGVPSGVCLDVLLKCPNLLECKVTFGEEDEDEDEEEPNLTQPTVLESLKSLTLSADRRNWTSRAFIRYCRFTNLQNLVWTGPSDAYFERIDVEGGELYAEFIHFFHDLPPTLTSLTFDWISPDSCQSILDVFLCVPQLKELKLIHSDYTLDFCEFIGQPISKFTTSKYTPHSYITRFEGSRILPSLRKLSLDYSYVTNPENCFEMLGRLHEAGMNGERFHFRFTASVPKRSWDKRVIVDRLRPLLASGLNLSFMIGNCELDLT